MDRSGTSPEEILQNLCEPFLITELDDKDRDRCLSQANELLGGAHPLFFGVSCDTPPGKGGFGLSRPNLFFCMDHSRVALFTLGERRADYKKVLDLARVQRCKLVVDEHSFNLSKSKVGLDLRLDNGQQVEVNVRPKFLLLAKASPGDGGFLSRLSSAIQHSAGDFKKDFARFRARLEVVSDCAVNPDACLIGGLGQYTMGVLPFLLTSSDGSKIDRALGWSIKEALGDACPCVAVEGRWMYVTVMDPTMKIAAEVFSQHVAYPSDSFEAICKLESQAFSHSLTWAAGPATEFTKREELWQSRLVDTGPSYFEVGRYYFTTVSGTPVSAMGLREIQSKLKQGLGADLEAATGKDAVVSLGSRSQEDGVRAAMQKYGYRAMTDDEIGVWVQADQEAKRKEQAERLAKLEEELRRRQEQEELIGTIWAGLAPMANAISAQIAALRTSMEGQSRANRAMTGALAGLAWYKFDRLLDQVGSGQQR